MSIDIIQNVSSDTFESLVSSATGPVALEFMSYGCGHCRKIEPLIQEAANRLRFTERVFRVNVAVDKELSDSFNITGTPTFVMFLAGHEVGRVAGPQPTPEGVMAALTGPFAV